MRKICVFLLLAVFLGACTPTPTPTPAPTPTSTPTLDPAEAEDAARAGPAEADAQLPVSPAPTIKLQFAGDILLHNTMVSAALVAGHTYDFMPYLAAVKPMLDGDLAICNMESPVDAFGDNRKLSSYPQFNVPAEIIPALKDTGFDVLVTANNHAFDMKYDGVLSTLAHIEKAGLTPLGTYASAEDAQTPLVLDVNGMAVGFLAYTDSLNGLDGYVSKERRAYACRTFSSGSLRDIPRMTEDMDAVRAAGAELVVVSLHWGAEYKDAPTQTQRDIAKALCEGGADIVMGNHAHCVQPVEWQEVTRPDGPARSLVIYSLGNFVADQIALGRPKTQYGMMVDVTVTKNDGKVSLKGFTCRPTLCYKYKEAGDDKWRYAIIPVTPGEKLAAVPGAAQVAAGETGRAAYEHVRRIVAQNE